MRDEILRHIDYWLARERVTGSRFAASLPAIANRIVQMLRKSLSLGLLTFCWLPLDASAQQSVVAGPNVQVSEERGDIVQVEPVIAVDLGDPNRMVAAAIGLRRPHDPDWQDHQTVLVYRSADGGRSWSHQDVATLPAEWTAGDPWLAWPRSDDLTLSAIAGGAITRRGDPPARARVFRSADGGLTWTVGGETPFAPSSGEDHPVLAADPRTGIVYSVATHATSRDEDEGVDVVRLAGSGPNTVALPPLRPDLQQVNLGGAVIGADGALVVTFFSMLPPRPLWSARLSPDAGTWDLTRIRESILPVGFPSVASDRTESPFGGRIYSAWVEGEDQADLRVLSAWSADAGSTWSEPAQVHADTSRAARTLPVIAVATDGAVGVVWQDRRLAGGRECTDLYGTISTDGGMTFLPEVRISSETACPDAEANGAATARFRLGGGDYQGLVGVGPGAFQAVWSDSRTGRYQVWTARLRAR